MLKRFPLHRIILFCWNLLNYMINGIYLGYNYMCGNVFQIKNETINVLLNVTGDYLNHSEF